MIPGSELDEMRQLRAALQVLAGGESQRIRLARDSRHVVGTILGRYAAVPSLADPRALLPLDAPPAALRAVLGQYAAGAASPLARTAAKWLGLASWLGLARPLLRHRVSTVAVGHDYLRSPLHTYLGDLLHRLDFVTSFRLAPGRPNGKPVVQVVAHDGTVLAYAKFGWEELTSRLIRHEAAVLGEMARLTRGSVLRVPEVLHAGEWQGLETLILAPLKGTGRTPHSFADFPVAASRTLAAVCPHAIERLTDSSFWRRSRARVQQLGPFLSPQSHALVRRARDAVEAHWSDTKVQTGRCHGDWIPPNMLLRTDGVYNVWDWERSASDTPFGIDAIQFVVFLTLLQRRPSLTSGGHAERIGRKVLAELDLDPDHFTMLAVLTLLQTLLWYAEARQAGREGEEDSRFPQALTAILDALPPPMSLRY